MIADFLFRLRSFFQRQTVEEELDEEMRFHLERQREAYVRQGMSADEAGRRVAIDFGGMEQMKENCRQARGPGCWNRCCRTFAMPCADCARAPDLR